VAALALAVGSSAAEPNATAPQGKASSDDAEGYVRSLGRTLQPSRLVVYKRVGDRELKLHVFLPQGWKATDARSCFLTIHGGGWIGGDARRMYAFADHFAKLGMVAASVEYRLLKKGNGVTVFDCVKDGRSAIRYVREHAADLGIDPRRILASGGSAGGHVAIGAALFTTVNEAGEDAATSAEPNAVIPLFPVIDTSRQGYGNARIGERWRELSPVDAVRPGLPPTLIFHGTADTTTPFAGAKRFHQEMIQAGNLCELEVHEGGAHGYLMSSQALFEETLAKMEAFMGRTGFLPARLPGSADS
jgi:acetyl esterase/lipase